MNWMPSGRKCGRDTEPGAGSRELSNKKTSGDRAPPATGHTLRKGGVLLTIASAPHVPSLSVPANPSSQMVRVVPVASSTAFNVLVTMYATELPSGDQNGVPIAPSVPDSLRASSAPSARIHTAVSSPARATNAREPPSGDKLNGTSPRVGSDPKACP